MKRSRIIEIIQEEIQSVLKEQDLNEFANFYTVTQAQKDKIDPENYKGTKKAVAQALKDKIKVGQEFTKADIKRIIGVDPLGNFKSVVNKEKIEFLGKTDDVKPEEKTDITPKKRGPKPGKTTGMDADDKAAVKAGEKDEVAKSAGKVEGDKEIETKLKNVITAKKSKLKKAKKDSLEYKKELTALKQFLNGKNIKKYIKKKNS